MAASLAADGICDFCGDSSVAGGSADGYVGMWTVRLEDAISRRRLAVKHPLCTAD
jgi:hypothetical protein